MKNQKSSSKGDAGGEVPVRSPCISNCCLDDKDICLGCFRHIDEITGWHNASNDQRLQIIDNIRNRSIK